MKRYTPLLLFPLLLVAILGVVNTAAPFVEAHRDPLERLELHTRALPAMAQVYQAPLDDEFAAQTVRLETVIRFVLGVQVNYIDTKDPDLFGFTQMDPKEPRAVNVSQDLHKTARLEILAHEAGHRLQPPTVEATSEAEVFAEAVSFLVCRAAGHDTLEKASIYLAVHKGGLHVLKDYRMEIDYAVLVLSGGMPQSTR